MYAGAKRSWERDRMDLWLAHLERYRKKYRMKMRAIETRSMQKSAKRQQRREKRLERWIKEGFVVKQKHLKM
jgi:hypothetical protein